MPANSPYLAARDQLSQVQRVLACATEVVARLAEDGPLYSISIMNPSTIVTPSARLVMTARQWILAESSAPRSWTATLVGYSYEVRLADATDVFLYHWHPGGVSGAREQHLHLGHRMTAAVELRDRLHIPTGHVSLSSFVKMLILELGARPSRRDWARVLDRAVV